MDLSRSQRLMLHKFCAYGFLKNLQFFEPFLLLFFTVQKGLSFTQFGALVAVREASIYVLEVPTGVVADVTGRRRAMMTAFACYLVSFSVFALTSSFWAFVGAMVFFGAGEAFRSGTHKAMIMQHLDLEGMGHLKIHYYGTTRAASRLGSAAAVLISGVLVYGAGSYQVVFLASMVPYVLGLLLMLTYPAELDGEVHRGLPLRAAGRHTVDTFRSIWRTRELARVLLNAALFYSFFNVAKDYLQDILRDAADGLPFGGTETQNTAVLVSIVYFLIHINEYVASRRSGRLADRLGHLGRSLNVVFWGFATVFCLTGVFLRIGAWSPAPGVRVGAVALAVLMLFLFYTANNLRMPMVTGFLSERTAAQRRATVLSVHSQLRALMAAGIAPLFGLVADHMDVSYAFLLGGAVLAPLGLLLRLKTDNEEYAAAPPGR
jgi:MFS family permease